MVDNFRPGEVYNIGGTELHDMKTISEIILRQLGKNETLVTYREAEPFTTKDKVVDVSKAVRDLNHSPRIGLEEGIAATLKWMRQVYRV